MSDPSLLVTRPTADRPGLAPAGTRPAVRPGARPNTASAARSTGTPSARATATAARRGRAPRLPGSAPTPRCCTGRPRPTGRRQGMAAGTPFALAHTFAQTGPFRPAQPRPRRRQRGARRLRRPCPGSACPTVLHVGPAGRRPDHRRRRPARIANSRRESARHDPLRAGRRRRPRSRTARGLPAAAGAQRPARQDVLPGHPAAGARAAPGRARAVRVRPLAPTTSSTTSTGARSAGRAGRQRLSTGCAAPRATDCGPAQRGPGAAARWSHTAARVRHRPPDLFDDFLASMRMDLTVTDYPTAPPWSATCTARRR